MVVVRRVKVLLCQMTRRDLPATVYGRSLVQTPGKMSRMFGPLQNYDQGEEKFNIPIRCVFFHFIFSKCNMTNLSRHSLRLIPWHCLSREQVCWIFIEFRKHTPSYVEITCLLSNKPKKLPDVTWNKNRRGRNFILSEKKTEKMIKITIFQN